MEQLRSYKRDHGDLLVPYNDRELGCFTNALRQQYKLHNENKKTSLTKERIAELNDLGFVWVRNVGKTGSKGQNSVPRQRSNDEKSSSVRTIKRSKEPERSSKNDPPSKKAKRLNDSPSAQNNESAQQFISWEERLQQLRCYKKEHGNLKVPRKHRQLGNFVDSTRKKMRLYSNNKKTSLTRERIAELDELGFVWSVHKDWEERMEELRSYKKNHGNLLVPHKDRALGGFVSRIRHQYVLYKDNKTSSLTKERIAELDEIGFVWSTMSAALLQKG